VVSVCACATVCCAGHGQKPVGRWGSAPLRTCLKGQVKHVGSPPSSRDGEASACIPIDSPRGLRGMEVPALAGGPCTGLRSCPPTFLALTRVTVDALLRLVPPSETALPAPRACCDALHYCRMPPIRGPRINPGPPAERVV